MSKVDPTQHYLQVYLQQSGHQAMETVHIFENFSSNNIVETTRRLTESASSFSSLEIHQTAILEPFILYVADHGSTL
jgi:serine acetyltransferase